MPDGALLGVERRRRWTDEAKPASLSGVGEDGWTVADVARRHDVARQHIYHWRREMRRKALWPAADAPVFLPVEMVTAQECAPIARPCDSETPQITIVLRNGRPL